MREFPNPEIRLSKKPGSTWVSHKIIYNREEEKRVDLVFGNLLKMKSKFNLQSYRKGEAISMIL